MKLPPPPQKLRPENTIPLINIVFLLLIFFVVAGTLTTPIDGSVKLVQTRMAEQTAPSQTLFVTEDGTLRLDGADITVEDYLDRTPDALGPSGDPVRLAVDRDLQAARLMEIVGAFYQGGAKQVTIITERSAP